MVTTPDRLKILKMIQEGKITAEEGMDLLDMLSDQPSRGNTGSTEAAKTARDTSHWMRVVVTDNVTGRVRVNVRLPVSLMSTGMKMGARFAPGVEGLDQSQLEEFIRSGTTGKIIDVYDDDEGEHVEIYIE